MIDLNYQTSKAGVPVRYTNFRYSDNSIPEWDAAWQSLKPFIRKNGGSIIALFGERGTGKTAMSSLAIRYLAHETAGQAAQLYVTAQDLFLDIKASYANGSTDSEDHIMSRMIVPDFLVIDAIENKRDTAYEQTILAHIIDSRYARMRITLLVGNNDWNSFASAVGVSTIDRIAETGIAIECNWGSFRSKNIEQRKE